LAGHAVAGPAFAHGGHGAPISYAESGARPLPVATQAAAPRPDAPSAPSAPKLSYRYPDQPDVVHSASGGAEQGAPLIDLRPQPTPAPGADVIGRPFDPRRALAQYNDGPSEAAPAPPQAPQEGAQPWLERERVGAPYQVNGRVYVPTPEPGYAQVGKASWYGAEFEGKRTANGEIYRADMMTAAHPTLPIPSLVQVTNLANGREVILRVNDRGPFARGRLLDVSRRAAQVLGFETQGSAQVHVRYLGPAPKKVTAADAAEAVQNAIPEEQDAERASPVAAPTASPTRASPLDVQAGYVVQVGAFGDVANAERARAQVRDQGVVSIDRRNSPSGPLHRVRVGPWRSLAEAERARSAIAARGFGGAVVAALR
jgi:rare lipoprotein A